MDKVKVNLLVKGNVKATGDIACREGYSDICGMGNKSIPDKYDLSDCAVIDGNININGSLKIDNGVILATGDVIII
ncbi:MAG: hypothetical protein K2N79_01730 [Muribaculaceae bacterium]|nr:hypothetical protein [Muribaculaceae bacterium]